MQPDDVYQNDGTYFLPREPQDQVVDRKKERAQTLEALGVAKTVIRHFQERIDFRDSLESIKIDLEQDPKMHQKMCEVNELLKLALIEEKQLLEDLLDTHAKGR